MSVTGMVISYGADHPDLLPYAAGSLVLGAVIYVLVTWKRRGV